MLVLTRRIGEKIIIENDDGTTSDVTVLGVKGCQVKMGVDAPKTAGIYREEVLERILRKQKEFQLMSDEDEKSVVNG